MKRKPEPRHIAGLCHFIAQDAILRQHLADRIKKRHLRLNALDFCQRLGLCTGQSRRPHGIVALPDDSRQRTGCIGCVRDDADIDLQARHLGGVYIDTRHRQTRGHFPPAHGRHLQPRAERHQKIGVGP